MTAESEKVLGTKENALAVEVVILTAEHEIHGLIHVSRTARADRRISDLLNNPNRRFLAVTDAKLVPRQGPSTPRIYTFIQLHIDNIIMIHPAAQVVACNGEYTDAEETRFDELRSKFKRSASP